VTQHKNILNGAKLVFHIPKIEYDSKLNNGCNAFINSLKIRDTVYQVQYFIIVKVLTKDIIHIFYEKMEVYTKSSWPRNSKDIYIYYDL